MLSSMAVAAPPLVFGYYRHVSRGEVIVVIGCWGHHAVLSVRRR